MRRNTLSRAPNKLRPGSKTRTRTPAAVSACDEGRRERGRAEAVDHQVDLDAAPRGLAQRRRAAARPTLSSTRMKVSTMTSRSASRDRLEDAREELLAVLQQRTLLPSVQRRLDAALTARSPPPAARGPTGATRACAAAPPAHAPRHCARRCGPAPAPGSAPGRSCAALPWACTKTSCSAAPSRQDAVRAAAPVVEVAGHDQRRVRRHLVAHDVAEQLELLLPVQLGQPEMGADHVHVDGRPGSRSTQCSRPRFSGSRPAPRRSRRRGSARDDRKLRQHRVAVVALRDRPRCGRRRTAATRLGQEFVVRRLGPVVDLARMARWVPSTSCRKTTSAPTVRTASRSSAG